MPYLVVGAHVEPLPASSVRRTDGGDAGVVIRLWPTNHHRTRCTSGDGRAITITHHDKFPFDKGRQ